MRTLMHVGGSILQERTLGWGKEVFDRVVLTDWNPHCYLREKAERFWCVSGDDFDGLLRVAREEGVTAIYCGGEYGLEVQADLLEALGLPGPSPAAVRRTLDKWVMTEIWRKKGIATTEKAEGGPAIIKPRKGSGSVGVRIGSAVPAGCVAEKIEDGDLYDVNGYFWKGAFYEGGVLWRGHEDFVPTHGFWPSGLSQAQEEELYVILRRGAVALGLTYGPVKADVIWTERGPILLEIAPRFHGDISMSYTLPWSPAKDWLFRLGGREIPDHQEPEDACYGWRAVFAPETGTIENVQYEGTQRFLRRRGIGDPIPSVQDNRGVVGFLLASGPDREAVRNLLFSREVEIDMIPG